MRASRGAPFRPAQHTAGRPEFLCFGPKLLDRIARLSPSPVQNKYDSFARYLVPLILAFGLACSLGFQVRGLRGTLNGPTFLALEHGIEGYQEIPKVWRTRLFSNWAAGLTIDYDVVDGKQVILPKTLEDTQQNWAFGWFLATGLMLVWVLKERSILFLLGTYAGLSYGYMPGITHRFYPWDMPILFFATLLSLAIYRRQFKWLFLIPLIMGFKETALMFVPGFILWSEVSWRKRILSMLAVGGLSLLVRVILTLTTHLKGSLIGSASNMESQLFGTNLPLLGVFDERHFVLFNAGLLCAYLFVPNASRFQWVLKSICLIFILGAFSRGIISEVRIWFELIPVALIGLDAFIRRMNVPPDSTPIAPA